MNNVIENVHEKNILEKYMKEGNIIKRDNKGINLIEIYNINN